MHTRPCRPACCLSEWCLSPVLLWVGGWPVGGAGGAGAAAAWPQTTPLLATWYYIMYIMYVFVLSLYFLTNRPPADHWSLFVLSFFSSKIMCRGQTNFWNAWAAIAGNNCWYIGRPKTNDCFLPDIITELRINFKLRLQITKQGNWLLNLQCISCERYCVTSPNCNMCSQFCIGRQPQGTRCQCREQLSIFLVYGRDPISGIAIILPFPKFCLSLGISSFSWQTSDVWNARKAKLTSALLAVSLFSRVFSS